MVRLYIADPTALSRLRRFGDVKDCEALLLDLAIPHGMPFVLDDNGTPIRHANRWLKSLVVSGCPSRATWIAYGRDYLHWHRFLAGRSTDPLGAKEDDVVAYFAVLRLGDSGADRIVSEQTWNRRIAALDGFYRYARSQHLIDDLPFTYRTVRRWRRGVDYPEIVDRNMAYEKDGSPDATIVWLEKEYLHRFLDIGMSGLLPNGEADPAYRGRNASRNRAFAEFLADTGLRAQEASHLLTYELPTIPDKPMPYIRMNVPRPVTKGRKGRWIFVRPDVMRTLDSYVRLERDTTLRRDHDLWMPERPLIVTDPTPREGRINGRKVSWAALSTEERQRLAYPGGGSPLLFLTSTGAPLTDWEEVFKRATQRCRCIGPGIDDFPNVTPHTLRHTFAVHMLRQLVGLLAKRLRRREHASMAEVEMLAGYWRMYDPLVVLRDLMGHASVLTTQVYLDVSDVSRLYAESMEESEKTTSDTTNVP